MKKIITRYFLFVFISVCFYNISAYAKEIPDELKSLYAQSAVLMDADSGRILVGKEENKILPMASTTKIMTCILALENMTDGQTAVVSEYAASQPKVHLGIRKDESYYLKDLLYSLMLESHNDSAVVIAEAIGGDVNKFVAMMNQKAIDIGCKNTYFITPNGLDAKNGMRIHATTASDLALIMRYCIEISPERKSFLEITRKMQYQFTDLTGKRIFSCHNHNRFLEMMEGALSGKTGFTNDAGYCYVGALRRGERTFIVALLACGWPNNKNYKWKDTRKLMEYALENYEYQKIDENINSKKILIKNGISSENPIKKCGFAETKILRDKESLHVLLGKKEKVEVQIIQPAYLYAPVKKNDKAGLVVYTVDGTIVKTSKIVISENIKGKNMIELWKYIEKIYLL